VASHTITVLMKRRLFAALAAVYCLGAAALAQAPSTVIHIINVRWKDDAAPEQIKAAVEAVRQLPAKYPGIKRVWTKNVKYQAQDNMNLAIVMEFESLDALRKFADSPAQKWWYELYLPIRDESATHDITN
jgi:uncharacterized protein (DUF1330 family)